MSDMDEDYGFEYSDEEQDEEQVDVENQYYNAKGLLENPEDFEKAIEAFTAVVTMEDESGQPGEWGFKAMKQVVKLRLKGCADASISTKEEEKKKKNVALAIESLGKLLSYVDSKAVTKNKSEKVLNSLLETMNQMEDRELLEQFYEKTLKTMTREANERLWFKIQLKLCKLWLKWQNFAAMGKTLKELRKSCEDESGNYAASKGTQLLEVYAMEIQMYTEQKNTKKLKELYRESLAIKSAIPHPRILGIIRECGGKMHIAERNFGDAATDFFEAFKSYDEAGLPRRVVCLKYLVLANMLMQSDVDPFGSQEAKPFQSNEEVKAMTDLVQAYQANDITSFESLLEKHKKSISEDAFVAEHIQALLDNVRTQVLLKTVRPYSKVKLPHLSEELNIPEKELESLLVNLVLDDVLDAKINQVTGMLEINRESIADASEQEKEQQEEGKKLQKKRVESEYDALNKWSNEIKRTQGILFANLC
ncbi:unnamed protein product [Bathycoccus prasinos]